MCGSRSVLKPFILLGAVTAVVAAPGIARADDPTLRLSFGGGITAGAVDSKPAIAASVAYSFKPHVAFEGEVTYVDAAADRFADRLFRLDGFGENGMPARVGSIMFDRRTGRFGPAPTAVFPVPGFRLSAEGRTLVGTLGFRYEIPSERARFRPYLSGGLGVARTEETLVLAADPAVLRTMSPSSVTINDSVAHTGLAVVAGAGASIRVYKELSLDVDARYFRLDRARTLGRFGGGFSVRF